MKRTLSCSVSIKGLLTTKFPDFPVEKVYREKVYRGSDWSLQTFRVDTLGHREHAVTPTQAVYGDFFKTKEESQTCLLMCLHAVF